MPGKTSKQPYEGKGGGAHVVQIAHLHCLQWTYGFYTAWLIQMILASCPSAHDRSSCNNGTALGHVAHSMHKYVDALGWDDIRIGQGCLLLPHPDVAIQRLNHRIPVDTLHDNTTHSRCPSAHQQYTRGLSKPVFSTMPAASPSRTWPSSQTTDEPGSQETMPGIGRSPPHSPGHTSPVLQGAPRTPPGHPTHRKLPVSCAPFCCVPSSLSRLQRFARVANYSQCTCV